MPHQWVPHRRRLLVDLGRLYINRLNLWGIVPLRSSLSFGCRGIMQCTIMGNSDVTACVTGPVTGPVGCRKHIACVT